MARGLEWVGIDNQIVRYHRYTNYFCRWWIRSKYYFFNSQKGKKVGCISLPFFLYTMLMHFVKKYYKEILFALFTIGIFFLLRLTNIMHLPIFTDEAIYTRWAQIAHQDANWRFISLTDGKQPLFVWLDMIIIPFVRDPLFAGRLFSVLSGLASMIG